VDIVSKLLHLAMPCENNSPPKIMRDANKMPDAFAEQLFAGNKNLNTVLTISLFYN
jgi:hypothetical protein